MKAVLLAAGRGTRLATVTQGLPKILVPIGGVPLVEAQLAYLRSAGVEAVAVNVHHGAEQVLAVLGALGPPPRVRCYHEPDLLGTAGALVAMRDFLDEPFVVLYGDVVTDSSLEALAGTHARSGAVATLGYHELHDAAGKGVIELDAGGAVAAFAEKPERGPPGPALVNAGVCIVEPRAIDEIDGIAPDLAYDLWPRLLAAGERIAAAPLDGFVQDVGTPDGLARVNREIAEGRLDWPPSARAC